MNESGVLSPESRACSQEPRASSESWASAFTANCSDLHHMKGAGPDIWFDRTANVPMDTGRTVEREASIPGLGARWNETQTVCI